MSFALHITWTTYGTWLPGDPRGHVSNIVEQSGGYTSKQNTFGIECGAGDQYLQRRASELMKSDAVWLTAEQAMIVANSLVESVLKRGWIIRRAAVMSNHLHALVMNCPEDGPAVRRALKGPSQAKLSDVAGHNRCWWTPFHLRLCMR
ncbi:MAG: hypothetical protein ACJ8C4_04690 [Gemmataceae bacterium]